MRRRSADRRGAERSAAMTCWSPSSRPSRASTRCARSSAPSRCSRSTAPGASRRRSRSIATRARGSSSNSAWSRAAAARAGGRDPAPGPGARARLARAARPAAAPRADAPASGRGGRAARRRCARRCSPRSPAAAAGPPPASRPGVALLDPADGRVVGHVDSLQQAGRRRSSATGGSGCSTSRRCRSSRSILAAGASSVSSPSPVEDVGYFAVARDRLWVADGLGPTVVEIDSRTGRVVRRLRVSADPHDTEPTTVIAVAYGSLWVSRPDRAV